MFKDKIKLIVIIIILLLVITGITLAFSMNAININILTGNYGIDYEGTLTLPSNSLYPVSDSVITSDVEHENIMKIEFSVKGTTNEEAIYDISLKDLKLDCELRNEYVKFRLYKNNEILKEGNLSPNFDTITEGRLVLTDIQQDLKKTSETADNYVFILWISEACEDINSCDLSKDQSSLMNKKISGKIEVELYTKNKHERQRVPENDFICIPNLDESGANTPDLVEGLIPIMYYNNTWVKADEYNSNETYKWYDYNSKQWANAVLVSSANRDTYKNADIGTPIPEADILAYYVWIPRYRYKVWNINKVVGTDSYDAYNKGIDIEFEPEVETNGTITCSYSYASPSSSAGSPNETCTGSNGDYYTHPAFTFGETSLRGIWVGKFEISSSNPATGTSYGGGQSTSLSVRIKPNVTSWRYNKLTNFSYVIQGMTNNSEYGISTDSDSHMIKNLEWGVVTYLAHSNYGLCVNGSCTNIGNNGYGETTNHTTMTGCGPISSGSTSYSTTCNAYNTTIGMEASTTGNIYGIYDMAGGSPEYVMGNMSSTSGSYTYYANNSGNNFSYSESTAKYIDTYTYGTSSTDQMAYNRTRLGDATGEIILSTGELGGWYEDRSVFNSSTTPWLGRGGVFRNGANAGLFFFSNYNGDVSDFYSTRAVLVGI